MSDQQPHSGGHPGHLPADAASRRGTRVDIALKGPLGCLAGSVVLVLAICVLVIAALVGLIAVTAAFWIATAILALGIIAGLWPALNAMNLKITDALRRG